MRYPGHLDMLRSILKKHQDNDDKALLVKLLKEEIAQYELILGIVDN